MMKLMAPHLDDVELLLVGLGRPVVLDDVPEVVLTKVQQQPHLPAGREINLSTICTLLIFPVIHLSTPLSTPVRVVYLQFL